MTEKERSCAVQKKMSCPIFIEFVCKSASVFGIYITPWNWNIWMLLAITFENSLANNYLHLRKEDLKTIPPIWRCPQSDNKKNGFSKLKEKQKMKYKDLLLVNAAHFVEMHVIISVNIVQFCVNDRDWVCFLFGIIDHWFTFYVA